MCIICIYVFLFIHPRYQSEIRWKMDYNHSNEPLAIWEACPSGVNWEWVDGGWDGLQSKDFIKMSLGQSLWGIVSQCQLKHWNIIGRSNIGHEIVSFWHAFFLKKTCVACIVFILRDGWLYPPGLQHGNFSHLAAFLVDVPIN